MVDSTRCCCCVRIVGPEAVGHCCCQWLVYVCSLNLWEWERLCKGVLWCSFWWVSLACLLVSRIRDTLPNYSCNKWPRYSVLWILGIWEFVLWYPDVWWHVYQMRLVMRCGHGDGVAVTSVLSWWRGWTSSVLCAWEVLYAWSNLFDGEEEGYLMDSLLHWYVGGCNEQYRMSVILFVATVCVSFVLKGV